MFGFDVLLGGLTGKIFAGLGAVLALLYGLWRVKQSGYTQAMTEAKAAASKQASEANRASYTTYLHTLEQGMATVVGSNAPPSDSSSGGMLQPGPRADF